jgi:hypothetical protein
MTYLLLNIQRILWLVGLGMTFNLIDEQSDWRLWVSAVCTFGMMLCSAFMLQEATV